MQLPISAQMTPREGVGSLYYSFASFDAVPFVRHGFSTRLGGVSRGPFSAMNLSFTRGDEAAAGGDGHEKPVIGERPDVHRKTRGSPVPRRAGKIP